MSTCVCSMVNFLNKHVLGVTVADRIVALKSIAASRGGLDINTSVSRIDAEDGLAQALHGQYDHVQLSIDSL